MSKNKKGTKKTISAGRPSRITYLDAYTNEIMTLLESRRDLVVTEDRRSKVFDMTPKEMEISPSQIFRFNKLQERFQNEVALLCNRPSGTSVTSRASPSINSTIKVKSSGRLVVGGLRFSIDDIIAGVGSTRFIYDREDYVHDSEEKLVAHRTKYTEHKLPFIKVVLRKSECFPLFEQRSLTVSKGTEESDHVEYDNKLYDHLTIGKGRVRRRSESEAQTDEVLRKSRADNTTRRTVVDEGTYVSYYEMFDTYQELKFAQSTVILMPGDAGYVGSDEGGVKRPVDPISEIGEKESFHFNSMILERLLASNVYDSGMRRFRNMNPPTKLDSVAEYRYSLNKLFSYVQPTFEVSRTSGKVRKAISDIGFCYGNGDLVAVAYGLYSYSAQVTVSTGNVCIWSIKNPVNPERSYKYPAPVTAVEFSPFTPCLIAVGMNDGSVQVRNITNPNDAPLAVSQRGSSPSCEPVIDIKWFKQPQSDDANEIDPFLALSLDGTVTRFRIISSPYLLAFTQMVLERVVGEPEGLATQTAPSDIEWQANRHPLGLGITMHPVFKDIYYVLTDEGCLHKCSTNYTHQYLEVWRTHESSVNSMDFSPWSPKLFLTCGNDWYIRIWIDGIFQPLVTLRNRMAPVHTAVWSRTHSTIILALNRRTMDIWDIRRNLLAPVSSTKMESSFNTLCRFSLCGNSVAIGNERGEVIMCALDSMPFEPHFQYDELEKALFDAIATFPTLIIELKSIGFFGYKGKRAMRGY